MPVEGESTLLTDRPHHAGEEAGTAPEDRRFRPDIQGLRAVAVTLVLLFHAHVPGMGGGYVGVDVFFVISGFVITGLLLRERSSTGSTSIATFYARRVRRILPAATLVILAAVLVSFPLLGPVDGAQTATDARWASVFLINVHFASAGTNYLASQLPPSLLQNYWSLAVEEQFYLIYPTIFLIVAALSPRHSLRRRLGIVLGAAILISFTASVIQTSSNATAAYFSPLPRVWELALGGLVATATVGLRRVPSAVAAVLSWSGVGLILLAAVSFSSSTAYPGWAVAVPVLGAALVIAVRRRPAEVRSRDRAAAASIPVDRPHLLFVVSLALAHPHPRDRTPGARPTARLECAGLGAARRGSRHRHLQARREPHSAQQVSHREASDQPAPRCLPDRLQPDRGDARTSMA